LPGKTWEKKENNTVPHRKKKEVAVGEMKGKKLFTAMKRKERPIVYWEKKREKRGKTFPSYRREGEKGE